MATSERIAAGDLVDTPDGRATVIGFTTDQDGLVAFPVAFRDGGHATYSEWEVTRVRECLGIEIPDIYDGVAIWIDEDGTMTNRLKSWAGFKERAAEVDRWIVAAQRILKEAGL